MSASIEEGPTMIPTSRPLRVLVVDDSEDTVVSCAELLRLYGHETRVARSGDEALALLDGWEPDIALLDLCMPGVSGYALARLICARSAGTRTSAAELTLAQQNAVDLLASGKTNTETPSC
jgi:CheY-like chemotaxis protein